MANLGTASDSSISIKNRPLILDIFLILGLLFLFATTALLFLIPWLPAQPASTPSLIRYVPVTDGGAWLGEMVNAGDASQSFRSENIHILAHQRALTSELRQAAIDELRKFVQKPGEKTLDTIQLNGRISTMQIILLDDQSLAADGKADRSTTVILRNKSGDFQVAAYYPQQNRDLVFDPPILIRPADFRAGAKWQTAGNLGNFQYQSSGTITTVAEHQSSLGNIKDCLKVSLHFKLSQQGKEVTNTTEADLFCSGLGLVAEQEFDPNGKMLSQMQVVSNTNNSTPAAQRKPISPMPVSSKLNPITNPEKLVDPAAWVLNVIGRTRTAADTTESTIQPLRVPANPPFLLVAGYSGDLLALDITRSPGKELWRFHPSGSIFGQPAFDFSHQQIYFGTSGKQMVALGLNGLYRWSFNCGDNIVSQPVVVGDVLVFGSEDRNVYGLDARSGALLWSVTTGGAVVASPTVDGKQVIIGSDDGVVYAFDARTGKQQWSFLTHDAIEAPLVSENGVIFIPSRDMTLYAVQASNGIQIWNNPVGHILRTRPAIGKNAVFLIDENGHLSAVNKVNGKLLWTTVDRVYEGAPVLVGNTILAAGNGGVVYRLSEEGKQFPSISGADLSPGSEELDFRLGLAQGGDAVWMVDTKGYIWRLGPTWTGAQPLEMNWSYNLNSLPFKQNPFYSAPQAWHSKFIVADLAGNIFQIDPATGQTEVLGTIKTEMGNFRTGLVITGDILLAASGNQLYAVQLPQIKSMWQFNADGFGLIPAAVDGNVAAWVTGGNNIPSANTNQLNLIDIKSGKLIRKEKLDGAALPGNAIVQKGFVYVNSPLSAYKIDSGQRIWEAAPENAIGIGQAALSPDGDTLYSELSNAQGRQTRVAAVAVQNGSLRWVKDLGNDSLSLIGTLWSDKNRLIVPLANGTGAILALDPATGNELWRYTPENPRLGNPSVHQDAIWFTLENGQVVALNLSDGHEIARLGLTQANLESYTFAQSISFSGDYALAPTGWSLLELKLPGVKRP